MTDHFKETRDSMIAAFAEHAATLFAADASRQSAMLAVSQYWNDSANDEVHGRVIVSSRATPVWPHECEYDHGDESNDWEGAQKALLPGEGCDSCAGGDIYMSFYGGYGDSMVGAFEQFCRESAHQGMETAEAYVPFAVARRVGTRVEVEIIGGPQREPTVMIDSARTGYVWPDARARELFDEVCSHPDDDGPRAVLSDYLLEAHPSDPRGEAIALALARDLDAETAARRDALYAEHVDRWLFPLGDVIVAGCAHFERGFLARADVYAQSAADRDRVASSTMWGTVHTIRFAPGSLDVIGPGMTALRDVGPLRGSLVSLTREPWAIERLRIARSAKDVDKLMRARTLPNLERLDVTSAHRELLINMLDRAPWRAQLERITFVDSEYGSLGDWRALRKLLDVPALAIAITPYWTEVASGWELAFLADDSVEVSCAGYHVHGTMMRLAELIGELPVDTRIALASTPAREVTPVDVAWLADYTGRAVALRAFSR